MLETKKYKLPKISGGGKGYHTAIKKFCFWDQSQFDGYVDLLYCQSFHTKFLDKELLDFLRGDRVSIFDIFITN